MKHEASRQLDALVQEVKSRRPSIHAVLREGPTVDEILNAARETSADVIVIGTHGRTGLPHVLLGSVAERVVRRASCPVLTVRSESSTQKI
jgi:nucleotide-binding universal stress UspA family protein